MAPLSGPEVDHFLGAGFLGVDRCLAAPSELAPLNRAFDRAFDGHLNEGGHPGLVQVKLLAYY